MPPVDYSLHTAADVVGIHQQGGPAVRGRERSQRVRLALVRLDVTVRHGAAQRHAKPTPSRHVRGSRHARDVGRSGGIHAGCRALRVPRAEVDNRRALGGNRQAVGGGRGHGLVMDRAEQIRLHDLRLGQRRCYLQDRLVPEHRRPLRHGAHLALEPESLQPVQKVAGKAVQRGQELQVRRRDGHVLQVVQRRLQPAGNQQVAMRWQAATEQVEGRGFRQAVFPVRLQHAELVEVGQQRVGGRGRARPSGHAGAACSSVAPASRIASSAASPSPGAASTARIAFVMTRTSSPGNSAASNTLALTQ